MGKMVKFFSLLLMVVFGVLAAEPETAEDNVLSRIKEKYRLTVTEVDPEHQCFKLSNKLICNITKKRLGIDVLPKVGNTVILFSISRPYGRRLAHIEDGELGVFVEDSGEMPDKRFINVWISGESEYPMILYAAGSLKDTGEEGASDSDEEIFVLSDASKWIRKSKETTVFSRGDQVVVSHFHDEEFSLINLDKSILFDHGGKQTFGRLAAEIVVPFNFRFSKRAKK